MKNLPWTITRETTPGEFVTDEKIRDSHEGVIATLHADSKVNGPLLCSAPELLFELERLVSWFEQYQEAQRSGGNMLETLSNVDLRDAKAAISKSKGIK